MKKSFLTIFVSLLFLLPHLVEARVPWQTNKLRLQKKQEAFEREIEKIPIYREKQKGDYQILGFVRGDDAFTQKKDAIIRSLRIQAYKMGADAIMEFKCRQVAKYLAQSCEGFAIKYATPPAPAEETQLP